MKKHLSILAVCTALSACSATGAQFDMSEVTKPPVTKAQLVIYRPSGFIGSAINWYVKVDGKQRCKLPQGSYFITDAHPGKTQVQIEQLIYTLNTEPKERDYIEITVRQGTVLSGGLGAAGALAADASTNGVYSNFDIRRQYEADALKDLEGLKQSTDCK